MTQPTASVVDYTASRPEREDAEAHRGWLNTPEAHFARRMSGWPDCTAATFMETLALVIESLDQAQLRLDAALANRGITMEQFELMVAERGLNVPDFVKTVADIKAGMSPAKGIRTMFLGGFDTAQIAGLLDLNQDEVDEHVKGRRYVARSAQILALHRSGLTPHQIEHELAVDNKDIYVLLAEMGLEPNRQRRKNLDRSTKARIVKLYRAKFGSYGEIADKLGVTRKDVSNTLAREHKAGRLPEYGVAS